MVTTYVDGHEVFPRFVGVCVHCGTVFGVRDGGGLEQNGHGSVPLARCPGCYGYVGMTERRQEGKP